MNIVKLHDNHVTLINGDSAEVMPKIKAESIDLTVTSPPYDDLRAYNSYSFDFETIAKELFRVTKVGGTVVWVVADQTKDFCESLSSFKQAIYFVETCGFKLLDTMIYQKDSIAPSYPTLRRYGSQFEYMFILTKDKPKTFNALKDIINKNVGRYTPRTDRNHKTGLLKDIGGSVVQEYGLRTNVWRINQSGKHADKFVYQHPAIFPEQLAHDHILSWSNENDVIFDPFLGSGTTAKMAIKLNRRFIGIELSEAYFNDIAIPRCNQAIGELVHDET